MSESAAPAAFLDIHMLQTLPLAGLNRDGDGSPKSVVVGGATRARISGQAKKRSTRRKVEEILPDQASLRTRQLVHAVRDQLTGDGWSEELATFAALDAFTAASGGKMSLGGSADDDVHPKDPLATAAFLYTPATTVDRIAALITGNRRAYEKALKQAGTGNNGAKAPGRKKESPPVTVTDPVPLRGLLAESNGLIAMLGRTLMEIDGAGRDACVQVASAFTPHPALIEIDFFTAVDDYAASKPGIPAVGQIGDTRLTAGTFYFYSTIAVTRLIEAVDGDTALARRLCEAYLDAFVHTLPGTGQTTAAAWTLPDLVHLAVRSDRPVNLSSAFDSPVHGQNGYADPSIARLSEYAKTIQRLTEGKGLLHAVHAYTGTTKLPGLGTRVDSFDHACRSAVTAAFGTAP